MKYEEYLIQTISDNVDLFKEVIQTHGNIECLNLKGYTELSALKTTHERMVVLTSTLQKICTRQSQYFAEIESYMERPPLKPLLPNSSTPKKSPQKIWEGGKTTTPIKDPNLAMMAFEEMKEKLQNDETPPPPKDK